MSLCRQCSFKVLLAAIILISINGCAELMLGMIEHQPQVEHASQVAHPDEIIIQSDGRVSYIPGVTGEDIILQLRGKPLKRAEMDDSEKQTGRQAKIKIAMLQYKHDATSPVECYSSPRNDGLIDIILLKFDPTYNVYTYSDMYIMESIPCRGRCSDEMDDWLKGWLKKSGIDDINF